MLKILSHIALSVLLLFSASGLTINMHFCQNHLYDIEFNAPAHDCCEHMQDDNMCHHDHDSAKPHQCDDEFIKIESSHDFLTSAFSFDFNTSQSLELFHLSQFLVVSPSPEKPIATRIFNDKLPPPQEVSLSVIQSFLI